MNVGTRLLTPGDPWKSYLLQRLQGNVPGSPMPLANIVQVATEAAGAVALSYVVDGVLIITGRTT